MFGETKFHNKIAVLLKIAFNSHILINKHDKCYFFLPLTISQYNKHFIQLLFPKIERTGTQTSAADTYTIRKCINYESKKERKSEC